MRRSLLMINKAPPRSGGIVTRVLAITFAMHASLVAMDFNDRKGERWAIVGIASALDAGYVWAGWFFYQSAPG